MYSVLTTSSIHSSRGAFRSRTYYNTGRGNFIPASDTALVRAVSGVAFITTLAVGDLFPPPISLRKSRISRCKYYNALRWKFIPFSQIFIVREAS